MHMNQKLSGRAFGIPAGVGLGALISLLITLAGAALASYLIAAEKIGEGAMGFSVMIILIVAAIFGAWCAVSMVKRLRLQVSMMSGACYYLVLLALTALFFGGQYEGMGVCALIILAGSALVALIPSKSGKIFMKKKRSYR